MWISDLINKILFRLKYRNIISKPYVATGHQDIYIKKNTIIKSFSSLRAHKEKYFGKIYIGEKVTIGEGGHILAGSGKVKIGNNTMIGGHLVLLGGGNVDIGDNVLISHNVSIASSSHNLTNIQEVVTKSPNILSPISIEDNVFIGAGVTILMGSIVKKGSIIGAGSVVVENTTIGENEIWYGNPARMQNTRKPLKEQIEEEMVNYFKKYPFHNIFLLNNVKDVFASEYGGTCSDRTVHFQRKLRKKFKNYNLDVKLHIASINNKNTHTILRIKIDEKVYFCDVGMGFPLVKLLPCDQNIEFTSYEIGFSTNTSTDKIIVFIDEYNKNGKQELMSICTKEQDKKQARQNIDNRYKYIQDLPIGNKLRYFFIHNDKFYQIKN